MKNKVAIGLLLLFIVGAVYIVYSERPIMRQTMESIAVRTQSTADIFYSLPEISRHNSTSSCWATINGSVYDLTDWVNRHPGGTQAIESLCGTDGSNLFNGQHGDSSRPKATLILLKIGELK